MRVAPAVVLSPEERVTLVRWARRNPTRTPQALRARIVLAAAEGAPDTEIGERLGIGRLTSARWRRRFLTDRLRGIERPLARRPSARGIPVARVREILLASAGIPGVNRRGPSSRDIARQFGLSHTTVRRIWLDAGMRRPGFSPAPFRPDPIRPPVARDVVGLYLDPPDRAIAFSLEPQRATNELFGPLPTSNPAAPPNLLPAASPSPPSSAPSRSLALRAQGLLRFLAEVERAIGKRRPSHVLATAPGLESRSDLHSYLARRPNIRLDWAPEPGAWTRRLELELGSVAHLPSKRSRTKGRSETARSIRLFLSSYAESKEAFRWVASPAEIAAQDADGRLRYELSVTGHPGFKRPAAVRSSMRAPLASDPRAREMARVVLRKSLRVKRGEHVAIESWSETIEYANAFVLETLQLGARPLLFYQDEPTYWAAVAGTRPGDLARLGDHVRAAILKSDVLVTFFGPSDRERFHALPLSVCARLDAYRDALYGAAAKAGARAVQIALGRASPASARMYGVDLALWKDELVEGTSVDPATLHQRARRVARVLSRGRRIELTHPNGTRLQLGLRERRPQVSDGLVPPARPGGDWNLVQLPAGVVSVALDERVAEGTFVSNVPNSVGVFDTVGEVDGGRWTFSAGRMTRYSYHRGQDLFGESYARGGEGKDRVGVLSVGLNPKISMAPLLLDQEAGTLTLQIGRNDSAGGTNHVNWWAWLLLREGNLKVDGVDLVQAGKLVG
jgi:leucyl aminopeptidase (aminopeptidase T)